MSYDITLPLSRLGGYLAQLDQQLHNLNRREEFHRRYASYLTQM